MNTTDATSRESLQFRTELGETLIIDIGQRTRNCRIELKIKTAGGSVITAYLDPGQPIQIQAGHDVKRLGIDVIVQPHDEDKPELRLVRSTQSSEAAALGGADSGEGNLK